MDDDRCIHDLLHGTCSTCAEQRERVQRSDPTGRPAFRRGAQAMADAFPSYREAQFHASDPQGQQPMRARYESTCSECHEPIWLEDLIVQGPDGFYVHEECA